MISSLLNAAPPLKSVPKQGIDDLYKQPLTLTVNGLNLKYKTGYGWVSEGNDIIEAADELEKALNHSDMLELENEDLRAELTESNDLRNVAVAMLMEEKTKRVALEKELEAYRLELKKAYEAINAQEKLRSIKEQKASSPSKK